MAQTLLPALRAATAAPNVSARPEGRRVLRRPLVWPRATRALGAPLLWKPRPSCSSPRPSRPQAGKFGMRPFGSSGGSLGRRGTRRSCRARIWKNRRRGTRSCRLLWKPRPFRPGKSTRPCNRALALVTLARVFQARAPARTCPERSRGRPTKKCRTFRASSSRIPDAFSRGERAAVRRARRRHAPPPMPPRSSSRSAAIVISPARSSLSGESPL